MQMSDNKQHIVDYDPRPPSVKVNNQLLLEHLRVSLLQSNHSHAFLQLLIAPISIALHDHTYALTCSTSESVVLPEESSKISQHALVSQQVLIP